MAMIAEVSETLLALLSEFGATDPTFQRMVSVYRDVAEQLGCRAEYEDVLRGMLAAVRWPGPCGNPPTVERRRHRRYSGAV